MDNSSNIENKIMEKIKTGKVKLRSRYIFLAEKMGLGSALALSVVLASLFFYLVLFYLSSSDNLAYLSFGSRGIKAFLESFPFGLMVVFIVSLLVAALVLKRFDLVYKKSFGTVAILLIVAVTLFGSVLTFTRLAERIEQETFSTQSPGRFFRPFIERGFNERHNGIVGRVVEIGDNYFTIQTPRNIRKIDISHLEAPINFSVTTGVWVIAVGERKEEGVFSARLLRVIEEDDMPMIGRGVRRRFNSFSSGTFDHPQLPCGYVTDNFGNNCGLFSR